MRIIRYLIDLGAEIGVQNYHGINLMHVSAQGYQATSIVYFLQKGLDVNVTDKKKNSTPLHWASYSGAETAVAYLTAFGAKVMRETLRGTHRSTLR